MNEMPTRSTNTFRFKLTIEVNDLITAFSKLHQFTDRKEYKEQWNLWYEANKNIIDTEISRLKDAGYVGNVKDKMFKAGRYYFRKKDLTCEKEPKNRRNYISMDCEVLTAMDRHINSNKDNDNFTPACGYDDFCKTNSRLLFEEIKRLNSEGHIFEPIQLISKIKKTYKNRYYMITH
jgi:hypothetical protein